MPIKTLMEVRTNGDTMTLPGGIALRYREDDNSYIVHNFNTDRQTETSRDYFQGTYTESFAEALDAFNSRVQRATGYDTGGSINVQATLDGFLTFA
jgi:hypothetical protein